MNAAERIMYDADGRAVQPCGAGAVTLFGDNVIHDPNGNWFYVHAPGIDEPLLAIKRNTGDNTVQARLEMVSNGHGQLVAVGDSAGQLNSTYAQQVPGSNGGPWGSGTTTRGQTFNPRRWATPGQSDTISTFRTRQYDPATGVWLQEDPVGLAGGVNLYEYNGNDPNSFSDPFGLCPVEKDGIPCSAVYARGVTVSSQRLVSALNAIAAEQDHALLVNSGDRTAAENAAVGGDRRSPHLSGEAADVRFAGTTKKETERMLFGSNARRSAGVRLIYHQEGSTHHEHSHLDLRAGPDLTEQRKGLTPRYVPLLAPEDHL